MKRLYSLHTLVFVILLGCSSDTNDTKSPANVTLNFSHYWDDTPVTNADFNDLKFTNAKADVLSIERLRYLISDIEFTKTNGQSIVLEDYHLIDLSNQSSLSHTPAGKIETGTYRNVSFTFGLRNEKNTSSIYPDLNAASWNVPNMLGGGYHFMQFDGKFINNIGQAQGFNYHAIRAVDNPGDAPTFPKNTFFKVNLGEITVGGNLELSIAMNIAEWFKNPHTWDLNVYNQMLMPNSTAQIMIHENGKNVFTLENIN